MSSAIASDRHLDADRGLDFFDRDHFDGVPRATVEEGAVGALAGALFAPDAEEGIHFDMAEGRMVLIGDPVHAIGHWAVGNAGGRSRAAGAAFGDDRKLLR